MAMNVCISLCILSKIAVIPTNVQHGNKRGRWNAVSAPLSYPTMEKLNTPCRGFYGALRGMSLSAGMAAHWQHGAKYLHMRQSQI